MLTAVILTLDAGAARAVGRLRQALAGQVADGGMRGLDVEPHLSLAVYEGLDPSALLPAVQGLAPRLPALPIDFPGLGIFPGEKAVLYLAPRATPALLGLHADYHHLAAAQARWCHDEFLPERWVPHCTLATGLHQADLQRAVAMVDAAWSPVAGSLSDLRLVAFPPVRQLYRRVLTSVE